jgi:hypothetical protein
MGNLNKDIYGTWGIKTNDELNNLIRNNNIINYNKANRLSRFGYVQRMAKDRVVKKLCDWKLKCTGLAGRPKIRGENDIKEYLRIMTTNNLTKCIQDRVKWKKVVERRAKTFIQ